MTVAVFRSVGYEIGPPDGDVLFGGYTRWSPVRAPYRPQAPGQQMLTFTVAGRGVYDCAGVKLTARRGDLVLVDRDSPTTHAVPAGEPWEFSFVRFDPPHGWMWPPVFVPIAPGLERAHVSLEPTRQRVQDAFARIGADLRRRDTARALGGVPNSAAPVSDEARRRLLLTILDEIFLLAIQDPDDGATVDHRIAVVLEAVGTDPARPYTVESLADAATLSPSRFAHLFTTQVGMSPMRTLRLIRLQHAARLLQCTSDPIGSVATASGFASIFDFSRQFRRQYGASPREYRARWRT